MLPRPLGDFIKKIATEVRNIRMPVWDVPKFWIVPTLKFYTFLIVLEHSSLLLGTLNMYFSIYNVQKTKRSRILGFVVRKEKNFPSLFKNTDS